MKIYVAVPVYDAKLPIQVVQGLLHEQLIAIAGGDEICFNFLSGNAGITQGRNQLATEFLDSGFDRLFFLDADITWDPGAIVALCHKPVDLVGGCYRFKEASLEWYPMRFLPGPRWTNAEGLMEVEMLPTGFLSISRSVFETMLENNPGIRNTVQCGHKAHCFFQMPFVDGHLFGEDFYFCRQWREMGGKVFLDPEIALTHWGFSPTPHRGQIGKWLRTNFGGQEGDPAPEKILPSLTENPKEAIYG